MGRPLSKKYFGNKVVGGLGGEGVASVVLNALGAYTTRPVFTFSAPGLPGGITATGTVTSEGATAAINGTATKAYKTAQVITEPTGGSTWTVSTITASSSKTISGVAISANAITLSAPITAPAGTSWLLPAATSGITGLVAGTTYFLAASVTAGSTITLSATYADAVSAAPTVLVCSGTPGGTLTGATLGASAFTAATVTVATGGSYEALTTAATATTAVTGGGAGQTLTITFQAKAIIVTLAGTGYESDPTAVGMTQGVTFTSVALTALVQNAISATAWTIAASSALTSMDIVKQINSHRYLVTTADGTGPVSLQAAAVTAVGQMIIVANDSTGTGTYWVTKLTNRKAWLTRRTGSGWEFATGAVVSWNLTAAVLNTSVLIPSK